MLYTGKKGENFNLKGCLLTRDGEEFPIFKVENRIDVHFFFCLYPYFNDR